MMGVLRVYVMCLLDAGHISTNALKQLEKATNSPQLDHF